MTVDVQMNIYTQLEQERQDVARRKATEAGLELVTPAAAAVLFNKSEPTIRAAARTGRIQTDFVVGFSEKEVRLYGLRSCVEFWGPPDAEKLAQMRAIAHVTFVANSDGRGGGSFNVLHPNLLVRIEDAAGHND